MPPAIPVINAVFEMSVTLFFPTYKQAIFILKRTKCQCCQ